MENKPIAIVGPQKLSWSIEVYQDSILLKNIGFLKKQISIPLLNIQDIQFREPSALGKGNIMIKYRTGTTVRQEYLDCGVDDMCSVAEIKNIVETQTAKIMDQLRSNVPESTRADTSANDQSFGLDHSPTSYLSSSSAPAPEEKPEEPDYSTFDPGQYDIDEAMPGDAVPDGQKQAIAPADVSPSYLFQLEQLGELRSKGILTEEEFEREKRQILHLAHKVEDIKCEYCESLIESNYEKCPVCGAPVKKSEQPNS